MNDNGTRRYLRIAGPTESLIFKDQQLTVSDFKAWLKRCKQFRTGGYTPDEIHYLARLAEFPEDVIYSVLTHFRDALEGSDVNNRANLQVALETKVIETLSGKVDLSDQWFSLFCKESFGEDFDD